MRLVLGLVLAGIGTGGATGAVVANGVRVIVLTVGAFVVMTVFTRWAGPPSPYSRTGAVRHDDDALQHVEPPAAVLRPQDLRVRREQLHWPANGEGSTTLRDRRPGNISDCVRAGWAGLESEIGRS